MGGGLQSRCSDTERCVAGIMLPAIYGCSGPVSDETKNREQ